MRYSADQIRSLLARLDAQPASALETETLEFKEWSREWEHGESGRRKFYRMLAEYAVCFANHRGGALVLMRMMREGLLGRSGVQRSQLFRLSGALYQALGDSIAYIREAGIDPIRYEEMILAYVRKYGAITNRITRELLGVSSFQASRLLKKLTTEGKLCKKGTYKDAAYRLP